MIEHLAAHPLVLRFAVAAVGVPLGRIRVVGLRVGLAAVLFAGLGFGAVEQAGGDLPHVGYATVFPLATVAKIVLARLVLRLAG